MSWDKDVERTVKEGVKKDLRELLVEIEGMTICQVVKQLAKFIWGIGYTEGYYVGYHEGKTGKSYLTKEEGPR